MNTFFPVVTTLLVPPCPLGFIGTSVLQMCNKEIAISTSKMVKNYIAITATTIAGEALGILAAYKMTVDSGLEDSIHFNQDLGVNIIIGGVCGAILGTIAAVSIVGHPLLFRANRPPQER